MGQIILLSLTVLLILQTCYAPPVTQNKKENEQPESDFGGLEDYMEYHRYLKEVVSALESDPDFRQKLEKAEENDIKSGKIADELQFVSHHVRTRLDEIKRVELQRLKELTMKKMRLEQQDNNIDQDPTHHHLDQNNPHTFEIEDLKKLISKTTQDLAEADKMRKDEFKAYELEKEYQKQVKLNHTNGEEREKMEKELKEMEEKHKKHEKLHEPGHQAQLEEVWEEQDQMQQDFDPKTFFMLHDIDGNGLWDQEEVKALFIKELDKMYQQGAPEDDMRERIEEMERMRESVFNEMDINRDGFIDFSEFRRQTDSNEFKQDHGWQGLDEQTRPYTDEELQRYIQRAEFERQHPGVAYNQHAAFEQAQPGAYQQAHPDNNQQFQPGQLPHVAPHPIDLNTNEIYAGQQQQYQQANDANQYPQQGYQQQYQHPNIQQQNQHPNIQQQSNQQPNVQQQQYQQPNMQQQYQPPNVQQQNQPNVPQKQNQPNTQQQQQYQPPNVQPLQLQQHPNMPNQQPPVPNVQQNQPPNMQQQQQNQHPNVGGQPQQPIGQPIVNKI